MAHPGNEQPQAGMASYVFAERRRGLLVTSPALKK
jgi:hypothetical protein